MSNELLFDAAIRYIKPELTILILVLWYIGTILKKSKKIADWEIPFILMVISIILCIMYTISLSGLTLMSLWIGLMQGFVIASLQGQGYQFFKQINVKSKEDV